MTITRPVHTVLATVAIIGGVIVASVSGDDGLPSVFAFISIFLGGGVEASQRIRNGAKAGRTIVELLTGIVLGLAWNGLVQASGLVSSLR